MSGHDREILREIRTFPSLVKFLRDDLDWPIESEDFEDLTFDFDAEELGIDAKTAAKIETIKQLRPLTTNQPWGIFFLKFEPKRLPVVAMRRILGKLVIKKRAAANASERASWNLRDLLFISSYGEGDERQISLAHFSDPERGDLPGLKVLGWDGDDTQLKLDHVASELRTKLRWPDHPNELSQWRDQWSSAFTLGHREVIRTSQDLAIRLADLACAIRKKVNAALGVESEKGPLRTLMKAFQEALIHDLKEDDFADMYAQTIAYGLLSARVSRPAGLVADDVALMVPITNPFLRELMETFLHIGGRKRKGAQAGLDFDELGINDVVALLRAANMEAVLRDFGNRNPTEDPVIHFYELFLKEYDAKRRLQRGVFYTPRPVVSYIVRSVDELLRTEFGLEDGLADTATWGDLRKRFSDLKLPEGVKETDTFVCILDIATGTGTFLVGIIDRIYEILHAKWSREGNKPREITELWNEYVPRHLLTRLHGYELMMAPYAIAHMKIGLKLASTGYRFGSEERARIYLTNSLDPPHDFSGRLAFDVPALAHEAQAVNTIKRRQRFTIAIGNPPYSNFGQLNRNTFILELLDDYKQGLDERKINLDDDFIKFMRFAQWQIERADEGIIGIITNNTYIDGITHRKMREVLTRSFNEVYVLDLHGSSIKQEAAPDGSRDENVFEITLGVAVALFVKKINARSCKVLQSDIWGERDTKYRVLSQTDVARTSWRTLSPTHPYFFFVPKQAAADSEYELSPSVGEAFVIWQNCLKTDRDDLFFDLDPKVLAERMRTFYSDDYDEVFKEQFRISASSSYDIEARRAATSFCLERIRRCLHRPFDAPWLYYDPKLTSRPAWKVMRHMLAGKNLALITCRQQSQQGPWRLVGVADGLVEGTAISNKTKEALNFFFPLYLYREAEPHLDLSQGASRCPNLSSAFLKKLADKLKLPQMGAFGLPKGLSPEDIFHYIYSVLHSPGYRSRYAEPLRIDFPRLPLTGNRELFRSLAGLGGELVALHLLESPRLGRHLTDFVGHAALKVEKVSYARNAVWIDKNQTRGFRGLPEAVWNFHVGGYQVCEKWLRERKGRTLSKNDIEQYHRIVVALNETIRLMGEIDEVIEEHGGWPGAFVSSPLSGGPGEPALPFE